MLALLLALLAAAPEDMAARVSRLVALRVPGMDSVRVQRDLAYDPDTGLRLDAYAPPRSGRHPVVVLLHGGVPDEVPVRPKDWGLYRSWGKLLAASGFATVIPNQRISFPDPRLALAEQDVAKALAFVGSHARQLSADPSRVCLVAFSAGGPLLAKFIRDRSPAVRCLAAMYAFLDIRQSDPHRQHLSPAQLEEFSPLVQMERAGPAMPPLFVAGAGDPQVVAAVPGRAPRAALRARGATTRRPARSPATRSSRLPASAPRPGCVRRLRARGSRPRP